tara:strand:+ start:9470 stop:9763 length:294 start_codon:yes stop_codon:yes gene_type:complete
MSKKKKEATQENLQELDVHGQAEEYVGNVSLQQQMEVNPHAEKWQLIELKTGILNMAKEILERNAALKWEQDKTKTLGVSHDEIIHVAKDILDFVLE